MALAPAALLAALAGAAAALAGPADIVKCCQPSLYLLVEDERLACLENDTLPGAPPVPFRYDRVGFPDCPEGFYVTNGTDAYTVDDNGTVVFSQEPENGSFCIDLVNPEDEFQVAVFCFQKQEPIEMAYPIGLLISLPFLFATFIVYALVKELRNLNGKFLMSHIFSLFMGYLTLAIIQLMTEYLGTWWCYIMGYLLQYFLLGSFFWLNVMCLDIFLTFGRKGGKRGGGGWRRLVIYSLYSWGCPGIIVTITILIDNFFPFEDLESALKPNIGLDVCFFSSDASLWLYFYGPMAILVSANIVMFAITAFRIRQHTRETNLLHSRESRRHYRNSKERERLNLYFKLFMVMGVNWVMELVSSVIKVAPDEVWYLTDFTNILQGVFIFIIFVCKPRVVKQLSEKWKRSTSKFSSKAQPSPLPMHTTTSIDASLYSPSFKETTPC